MNITVTMIGGSKKLKLSERHMRNDGPTALPSAFFACAAKLWISCAPMGQKWVENSAMVLIFCPIISIWHARCDKNPLATYQSRLRRDSTHLRNGLYWKTAVFQFFAFYDFCHPKWPPNGKIWTWVVIGHMSGYVWRWFRPLRSAA